MPPSERGLPNGGNNNRIVRGVHSMGITRELIQLRSSSVCEAVLNLFNISANCRSFFCLIMSVNSDVSRFLGNRILFFSVGPEYQLGPDFV